MTTYDSLEALRASMPAYVLGALSPEDRLAFETALRQPDRIEALRTEFDACQATLNALASAQPLAPPGGLLERVLGAVRGNPLPEQASLAGTDAPVLDRRLDSDRRAGDRRMAERRVGDRRAAEAEPVAAIAVVAPTPARDPGPTAPAASQTTVATATTAATTTATAGSTAVTTATTTAASTAATTATTATTTRSLTPLLVNTVDRRNRPMFVAGWVLAGLLFLATAGLGYYAANKRRETAAAEAALRDSKVAFSRSEARLTERERLLATMLSGRAAVLLVTLRSDSTNGPVAQMFWNTQEGKAIVSAQGLTRLPHGFKYQMWLLRDFVPTPLTEVPVEDDGSALISGISMPSSPTGITQAFVTVEAAGDSVPTPSRQRLMSAVIPIYRP